MKIRSWNIAINSHPDWMLGTICVQEMPLWVWIANHLTDRLAPWDWTWKVRLPSWITKRINTEIESLGDFWYLYIFNPAFQWSWKHFTSKEITVELGYTKIRELFYSEYPEHFKYEASIGSEEL